MYANVTILEKKREFEASRGGGYAEAIVLWRSND